MKTSKLLLIASTCLVLASMPVMADTPAGPCSDELVTPATPDGQSVGGLCLPNNEACGNDFCVPPAMGESCDANPPTEVLPVVDFVLRCNAIYSYPQEEINDNVAYGRVLGGWLADEGVAGGEELTCDVIYSGLPYCEAPGMSYDVLFSQVPKCSDVDESGIGGSGVYICKEPDSATSLQNLLGPLGVAWPGLYYYTFVGHGKL